MRISKEVSIEEQIDSSVRMDKGAAWNLQACSHLH